MITVNALLPCLSYWSKEDVDKLRLYDVTGRCAECVSLQEEY